MERGDQIRKDIVCFPIMTVYQLAYCRLLLMIAICFYMLKMMKKNNYSYSFYAVCNLMVDAAMHVRQVSRSQTLRYQGLFP